MVRLTVVRVGVLDSREIVRLTFATLVDRFLRAESKAENRYKV